MTKRAPKGGAYGANGEWYEGGKFINTVAENRKKEGSTRGTGKVEIEPYVWVVPPADCSGVSLYRNLAGIFGRVENGVMVIRCSQQTLSYFGKTLEQVQAMADAYNAGQRWMAGVNQL